MQFEINGRKNGNKKLIGKEKFGFLIKVFDVLKKQSFVKQSWNLLINFQ